MEIRRCSSSSTITEKDTLMTQNLCLRETDFTSDTKLPLLQEKKKSVQCWKEPKWFLETETQINKSQLKATGRTWTLLGQYYCLQSSVILSSKKKLLDFLRSHGSLVTTETNKIQTRSCFVSEIPEDHT